MHEGLTKAGKRAALIAFFAGSLFLSASANAQEPLSATDYKAAYCVGRLRDAQIPQPSASYPEAANDMLRQFAHKIDQARSRLKFYLLTRLSYVDPTALMATTEIGAKEQQEYARAIEECSAKSGVSQSYADMVKRASSCANPAEAAKLKDCQETAFLPF